MAPRLHGTVGSPAGAHSPGSPCKLGPLADRAQLRPGPDVPCTRSRSGLTCALPWGLPVLCLQRELALAPPRDGRCWRAAPAALPSEPLLAVWLAVPGTGPLGCTVEGAVGDVRANCSLRGTPCSVPLRSHSQPRTRLVGGAGGAVSADCVVSWTSLETASSATTSLWLGLPCSSALGLGCGSSVHARQQVAPELLVRVPCGWEPGESRQERWLCSSRCSVLPGLPAGPPAAPGLPGKKCPSPGAGGGPGSMQRGLDRVVFLKTVKEMMFGFSENRAFKPIGRKLEKVS